MERRPEAMGRGEVMTGRGKRGAGWGWRIGLGGGGGAVGEPELLDAFDADDAAVVDDDLDGSEAEGVDVLLDDAGPVGGIEGPGNRDNRLGIFTVLLAHC